VVPAVSLNYVFNHVKQLHEVHGDPGFVLHRRRPMDNGAIDSEIRMWF